MKNKTDLETAINNAFNTLYAVGDSISLCLDNRNIEWIRCAVMEKGIAILIEMDSFRSPFIRSVKGAARVNKGVIRLEEVTLDIKGENCKFIAVYCRKKSLSRVFERLAADLIMHVEENSTIITDPWASLRDRIEGWRMLFNFNDNKAEEKGLIGELFIFKHLREQLNIIPEVWTGPVGGTKDFMLGGCNIEVKTTTVRYGYFVEISGLFQTQTTQQVEKLVFVRLEETPNGKFSTISLVNEIRPMLNETELITFNSLLSEYNEDIFNSPNRYSLLELVFFDIDSNFPKISEQSFVNNRLPDGVIRLTWTADLGILEPKHTDETIIELKEYL